MPLVQAHLTATSRRGSVYSAGPRRGRTGRCAMPIGATARRDFEPGVTNLDITKAAAPYGLYYAPDPSSQQVCTIGGNVAENSGGAHCLKYGFTTNHVLALEVVLGDGSIVTLGGDSAEQLGPDLR